MKMVIAYIQPYKAHEVMEALQAVGEIPGASLIEVRGFGRGRGKGESAALATQVARFGMLRKQRIEMMIPDELEDKVVNVVKEAAYSGQLGDGKIYVVKLDRAVRIRTGEEGPEAL